MHFIAYTIKGLEQIVADEITERISGARIIDVKPKRVIFDAAQAMHLGQLKTADDVGLLLGQTNATTLDEVVRFIQGLDLESAQSVIEQVRPLPAHTFSVTTTLAGVNSFTGDELSRAVSDHITRKTDWEFTEFDHSNFDIRIFADHHTVYCSVRLLSHSLYERPYKTVSRPGSLRPSIAAAMVTIATRGKTGLKVADNFCGSGTILAEALVADNTVYGGDIEPESVAVTRQNLANLKYKELERIVQLDATKTKWPSQMFDCGISNLPWGKQIAIERITDLYRGTLKEYARVLKPGGTLCLLIGSKPELLIKHAKQVFQGATITTWKLGYLGQTPSIVLIS